MPYRDYNELADALYRTCVISDPWLEGRERFGLTPVILDAGTYRRMSMAAEAIARLYDELCRMVWNRPDFLDSFFHLTPYQKLMWLASEGQWHGISRLDLFVLGDGSLRMCEMNSDTPSGEAEAILLNRLLLDASSGVSDPNVELEHRFVNMVQSVGPFHPTIGIVYPTEMPEDLSMIRLYQEWLESRGCRVVMGSPYNLRPCSDRGVAIFDTRLDVLLRHYKTDWWSERRVVWTDEEPFPDEDPLDGPLRYVLDAVLGDRLVVINPFGSVLTQNKLSLAFFWQHMDLFSEESRHTIRSFIPETVRLADAWGRELPRIEWVLKTDYGCEGDDVIIGPHVSDDIWQASIEKAVQPHWIAQKYFDAAAGPEGLISNHGLYVIAGEAAGIYTRRSAAATDHTAISTATYIRHHQSC